MYSFFPKPKYEVEQLNFNLYKRVLAKIYFKKKADHNIFSKLANMQTLQHRYKTNWQQIYKFIFQFIQYL